MSKKIIIPISIVVSLLILFFYVQHIYNSLVTRDEGVETAWGQVENQYQRRLDLIPNLVNTVKGYAAHEKETLAAVVEARTKATQVKIDPANFNAASLAKFEEVQGALSSALSKLMVVVEKYPDLKASQNFVTLQAQLEGTENRIAYERNRFNESVKSLNVYCRSFPNNIFAGMFGFKKKEYFKSDSGADKAVNVEF